MYQLGLVFFILSIYWYGLAPNPWIKLVPGPALFWATKVKWPLVLAGLGDLFLDFNTPSTFGVGLTLFSGCQLGLVIEAANRSVAMDWFWNYPWAVGSLLIGSIGVYFVLSYYAFAIFGYALILLQLLVLVGPIWATRYGSGCLFFILSDLFVLAELILTHSRQTIVPLKVLPRLGLPIYWTALLLIALDEPPLR